MKIIDIKTLYQNERVKLDEVIFDSPVRQYHAEGTSDETELIPMGLIKEVMNVVPLDQEDGILMDEFNATGLEGKYMKYVTFWDDHCREVFLSAERKDEQIKFMLDIMENPTVSVDTTRDEDDSKIVIFSRRYPYRDAVDTLRMTQTFAVSELSDSLLDHNFSRKSIMTARWFVRNCLSNVDVQKDRQTIQIFDRNDTIYTLTFFAPSRHGLINFSISVTGEKIDRRKGKNKKKKKG